MATPDARPDAHRLDAPVGPAAGVAFNPADVADIELRADRLGGTGDHFTVRPEQWRLWSRRFLPPFEPFFTVEPDTAAALAAAGEIVYTRAEFGASFLRFSLDHGHAYHVWSLPADSLVWCADRAARERLDRSLWARIRDEQGSNGRGQVYDDGWPLSPVGVPAIDRLPGGRWLLAPDTWLALEPAGQRRWLREWIRRRISADELRPITADVDPRYRDLTARYANTFADASGPNCFSAALGVALGRPSEIFPLWLHQEPFLRALGATGYRPVGGLDPQPADVVVWADTDGSPVHAACCVAEGVLFNKNGQSWDQPYALIAFDDVRDFDGTISGGGSMVMYRRFSNTSG